MPEHSARWTPAPGVPLQHSRQRRLAGVRRSQLARATQAPSCKPQPVGCQQLYCQRHPAIPLRPHVAHLPLPALPYISCAIHNSDYCKIIECSRAAEWGAWGQTACRRRCHATAWAARTARPNDVGRAGWVASYALAQPFSTSQAPVKPLELPHPPQGAAHRASVVSRAGLLVAAACFPPDVCRPAGAGHGGLGAVRPPRPPQRPRHH
jgi:hypothetical protein